MTDSKTSEYGKSLFQSTTEALAIANEQMAVAQGHGMWWVRFNDECRNFACGVRLVEVLTIGNKWVTFRHRRLGDDGWFHCRNRIKRAAWDRRLAGPCPPHKVEEL